MPSPPLKDRIPHYSSQMTYDSVDYIRLCGLPIIYIVGGCPKSQIIYTSTVNGVMSHSDSKPPASSAQVALLGFGRKIIVLSLKLHPPALDVLRHLGHQAFDVVPVSAVC